MGMGIKIKTREWEKHWRRYTLRVRGSASTGKVTGLSLLSGWDGGSLRHTKNHQPHNVLHRHGHAMCVIIADNIT